MYDEGYPPDPPEQLSGPQPEVCALCGLPIPVARMFRPLEGPLGGHLICDVTPSCKRYRELDAPTQRRLNGHLDWSLPSRYEDPGAPNWWDPTDDPKEGF